MRPTVCGSLHCNAAKLSMSDRQALGFHRPPAADRHVEHGGEVDTKVGYFGVKLTKVPLGADGHQTC
eukprot:scaffold13130_cov56-Phaeocystis_antarctica.AAC.3